jgi:predicted lipoprotein
MTEFFNQRWTSGSRLFATVGVLALVALAGCGSDDSSSAPTDAVTKSTQATVCPMEAARAKSFDATSLVGMSLGEAKAEAAKYECTVRTVELDGKPLAATMDFNKSRVNVSVKGDKVTAIQSIG